MIYGYARVSTKTQAKDGNSLEARRTHLKAAGAAKIYADAFTGTRSRRPELDKLLAVMRPGDMLKVTKLDRVARSAAHGIGLIQSLLDKGIIVHMLNMGMMDNTPMGKLVRNVMLAFAGFERDMIVERTGEGKAIPRQNPGFKEGRPPKYGRAQLDHVMEPLDDHSYKEVAEMTGISKSTLLWAERKQDPPVQSKDLHIYFWIVVYRKNPVKVSGRTNSFSFKERKRCIPSPPPYVIV